MAITDQFAGLQMDKLIGAPLAAAADTSIQLANATADFINRVGFENGGKLRTVPFMYQKRSVNEDGTSNLDEMKVEVPMLAIVPIPNLQVDEVNILFDMEVKQSEKQESSLDIGATVSGTVNLGIVKLNVSGSVSAHSSNTRSSDNSAKYHVDVRATNHGIPEGLARVLDMMAANIAPALLNSSIKDANGQNLPEAAKAKAERLKALRQEISQIENRLGAARSGLDNYIQQMKKTATSQQGVYDAKVLSLTKGLDEKKPEDLKKKEGYEEILARVHQSWSVFQNQAPDMVKMLADSGSSEDNKVSGMLALKSFMENDAVEYGTGDSYYTAMAAMQKNAVAAQLNVTQIESELFQKKAEYSDTVSGKSTAALPEKAPESTGKK